MTGTRDVRIWSFGVSRSFLDLEYRLHRNEKITKNKHSENAVVEIENCTESSMIAEKRSAARHVKKPKSNTCIVSRLSHEMSIAEKLFQTMKPGKGRLARYT